MWMLLRYAYWINQPSSVRNPKTKIFTVDIYIVDCWLELDTGDNDRFNDKNDDDDEVLKKIEKYRFRSLLKFH